MLEFLLRIFLGVFAFALALGIIGGTVLMIINRLKKSDGSDKEIAVLNLKGVISDQHSKSDASMVKPEYINTREVVDKLEELKEKSDLKGLLLKINSPGGSAVASETIYQEIKKFRKETDLPVYASLGDIAASGGFYLSLGAEKTFTNHSTLTGSIGVIFSFLKTKELLEKIGVEDRTFKSGEYKDIGNPARDLTEEEEDLLTGLIDDVYEQFFSRVKEERGLSEEEAEELARGQLYTGSQAVEYNLADELGTTYDALVELKNQYPEEELTVNYYQPGEKSWLKKMIPVLKGKNLLPGISSGLRFEFRDE